MSEDAVWTWELFNSLPIIQTGGWGWLMWTPTLALAASFSITAKTCASGRSPSRESFSGSSMMSVIILASAVTVQPTRPWGCVSPRHSTATIFQRGAVLRQLHRQASSATAPPPLPPRNNKIKSGRWDVTSAIIFYNLFYLCSFKSLKYRIRFIQWNMISWLT